MITFSTEISEDNILNAFNNNVVRFSSDSEEIPITAVVTIGTQSVTLYPLPNGSFYFNFKEYIIPLVNNNNFKDTVNPELDAEDYTTFTYLGDGLLLANVTYLINFANEDTDTISKQYAFLPSVVQLEDFKKELIQKNVSFPLLTLYPETNNTYYVKYWEGYPFDITFKNDGSDIELINNSNLLDYTFETKGNITRLFFCDGRIDESINDLLPISLGRSTIEYLNKYIVIDKEDVCDGVYLKWFNPKGGYSYWKFPNIYQRTKSMKSFGELNNDFENVEDTFSQVMQIGQTATNRLVVDSDKLKQEEFNLLSTVLTSPKVYLFVGQPFAKASVNDWLECRVATSSQTTRNLKGQALSIRLDLELPDDYTQNL
jgi:hypothetical protein